MTDKDLRRLGRTELIEIIAAQKKRELELQRQLQQAQELLKDRTIRINHAGSIADAALALHGVFEAAQHAADAYLDSVVTANEEIEEQLARAEEEAAQILADADREAAARIRKAEQQCAAMLAEADQQVRTLEGFLSKDRADSTDWRELLKDL